MNIAIDWDAFLQVFIAAFIGASVLVSFYAMGLRLLVRAGRAPVVGPAEFTDAIAVISEKDRQRAAKAAAKAAKRSPLTDGQKKVALLGAYACFAVCAAAVLFAIGLIVLNH
ncbi:peptidase [Microbacterium sp. NC79]|uniref:peptidase n=1 Tax=Microbacterium sp. NC79 TaxID=2851009 RepID=UPI001C2B9CDC|nr:peptidase [Microbacterium sp. NC79]MBV0895257.1 peptidase [Microbacterium sp. NC79]